MVECIVEWIVLFIVDNLLIWIRENGGWVSFNFESFEKNCFGFLFILYYFKYFLLFFFLVY